jgi:hypothetical protein
MSTDKRVAERLGFDPREFCAEISTAISDHVDIGVEGLRKELATIAKNKGYKNVTPAMLDECCRKLQNRMKSAYEKNMNKFSVYVNRNIFVLPSEQQQSSSVASASGAAKHGESDPLTEELERLREKYLLIRQTHAMLSNECRNADLLLKDMRGALFALRIGAQALENHQVQPLNEAWAIMEQHKQKLSDLSRRAADMKGEMNAALQSSGSSSSSGGGAIESKDPTHHDEAITTGTVDDMKIVHDQMQRGGR